MLPYALEQKAPQFTFRRGILSNYMINKCCHMAFGKRFIWVTDCYLLKFILLYDGRNPAILRLQMRFMCWDMVIEHQNDVRLTDANYFSRLGADLCFDFLLKEYVQQVDAIRCRSPALTGLPTVPVNQPYFRGPCLNMPRKLVQHPPAPQPLDSGALAAITTTGHQHLSNWPVTFGTAAPADAIGNVAPCCLRHHAHCYYACPFQLGLTWLQQGTFLVYYMQACLPFKVVLVRNPIVHGSAFFCKLSECKLIMNSAPAILDHIGGSSITPKSAEYIIHSH
jgi:hypothetical protein